MVLIVAVTFLLFGNHNNDNTTRIDMEQHDMSKMMDKPTVEATIEGLHMKVWLMTERQHKKMMKRIMGQMMHHEMGDTIGHMSMSEMDDTSMGMGKGMMGMKHHGMEMNKAMMDSMMAGTHCIMLEVSDAATQKDISDASVKVMIISPSKKHSSVNLKPMMKQYGSGLTLHRKGKYRMTVSVTVNEVSRTTDFPYRVR